jgi:hypothetical protein
MPRLDFGYVHFHSNVNSTSLLNPLPPIAAAMFLQRSAIAAARRAAVSPIIKRSFASSVVRRTSSPTHPMKFACSGRA